MLDFLTLVMALVALIAAFKAFNQVSVLRARLEALEATLAGSPAGKTCASNAVQTIAPPPLPPHDELEQAPMVGAPGVAAEQPAAIDDAEPAAPLAADQDAAPGDTTGAAATPPLPPLPGPGIEERIGTRWVVWVGGLTLALGGFFMVRYSIEAGLLGPGVRTLLGGAFALALLAAGEWTRRKESISTIAALPIANIPAMLTAAGTAVAFATVYAAYALYGFLVPATAFILLGLVALGTLAAALLHGPALAGLGIAAAFVTPILVSSNEPDYWALYIYLAVVTAAAFGLARIRLWRWLAVTTIVLALLWTLPCLQCGPSMLGPHLFHVIAGFVLAALLVVCGFLFGPPAEEGRIEPVSSGALAASLLGATLIVLASFHADAAMIAFAILVAGALFVAWRAPSATGAVGFAALFVAIVFFEWAVRGNPDMLVLPGGPLPGIGPNATDGSVSLHLTTAAIFAAGFGVAGFLAQGRSLSAIMPVVWSAAAVFTPLALLISLYARIAHLDRSIPFAILAVILAAAYGAATEALARRDTRPGLAISTALFATGTLGALALALTFALERGWLTIALALMSMGTAWISLQRPIPFLRSLSAILAGNRSAADRIRAAHRRRGGRHHADLQLAVVGLWHSRAVVLGRQHLPAPARRRRAAANGGVGRDPVHGAAGVHGNSPRHERRQRLSRYRRPDRDRAACLRRLGDGDRVGAAADSHQEHHPQCQRGIADGVCRIVHRGRAVALEQPRALAHQHRRRIHQYPFARLCDTGGARLAAVLCGGGPAVRWLRQYHRCGCAGAGAELCDA